MKFEHRKGALAGSDCGNTGFVSEICFPLGFCSLQMAVLEIQGNGESSYVPQEAISSAIQLLEDSLQRVRVIGTNVHPYLIFKCFRFLLYLLRI